MPRTLRILSVFGILLALSTAPVLAADTPAAAATPAVAAPTTAPAAPAPAEAPAEPPQDDAAKQAAILQADAIATFDPAKVVGNAKPWDYYFQPAVSPTMKSIASLHNFVFIIITLITLFVLGLIVYICVRFSAKANPKPQAFSHNTLLEIVWTAVPILILVAIGIPSIRAHYAYTYNQEIIDNPDLTLKVVGHQWYWTYEYPDHGITFDSNIKKDGELAPGEPRLLAVDNPIVVPVNKVVRVQITAADVLHAWAVPAFGVKRDAVPGRLNETWFKAEKEGIYYGQCSELCGKFHGFMPIQIHVVSEEQFNSWVTGAKLKFADSGQFLLAANE